MRSLSDLLLLLQAAEKSNDQREIDEIRGEIAVRRLFERNRQALQNRLDALRRANREQDIADESLIAEARRFDKHCDKLC